MNARLPTPVRRLHRLSTARAELWLKDDGSSNPTYGGNKGRKLAFILPELERKGAQTVVTVGAAGSHHALATALLAPLFGLRAKAVLFPQPWSRHAQRTLCAALQAGLEVHPARSQAAAPVVVAKVLERGDAFVPPGGAGMLGMLGYFTAARELAAQIRAGELPEPDFVVLPLGTGTTSAGLLAGFAAERLKTRIIGVTVGALDRTAKFVVSALAARASRRFSPETPPPGPDSLVVERTYTGTGYGWPTARAHAALEVALAEGLNLETTYTAKAFAKALELISYPGFGAAEPSEIRSRTVAGQPLRVLYWHTLAATPAEVSTGPAPGLGNDADLLRRLFIQGRHL